MYSNFPHAFPLGYVHVQRSHYSGHMGSIQVDKSNIPASNMMHRRSYLLSPSNKHWFNYKLAQATPSSQKRTLIICLNPLWVSYKDPFIMCILRSATIQHAHSIFYLFAQRKTNNNPSFCVLASQKFLKPIIVFLGIYSYLCPIFCNHLSSPSHNLLLFTRCLSLCLHHPVRLPNVLRIMFNWNLYIIQ